MTPLRRSVRLNRIKELLQGRRAGMTPAELARATGVSVRSIQRDLIVLQFEDGLLLTEQRGRYAIAQEDRLTPLQLTLQEARAFLIATRLFMRYSDEAEPHATSALRKLAEVMPPAVKQQVRSAAESLAARPFDPEFSRTLTTVTDAWARNRALKLSYRSAGKQRPKEVIVEPYFLEPSAAGFSTYLIGYSRTHEQIRTFKIERIVSAEMLPIHAPPPADLDVDQLLSSAWGIIFGEGMTVRLRFTPDVTWRVKESRWHPSQSIEDLDDGGCILMISVASMMELGRWVRGWGDRVEVLAPPSLREELRVEAAHIAKVYARAPTPSPRKKRTRAMPTNDRAATEASASGGGR